jgi:hypothetical protein
MILDFTILANVITEVTPILLEFLTALIHPTPVLVQVLSITLEFPLITSNLSASSRCFFLVACKRLHIVFSTILIDFSTFLLPFTSIIAQRGLILDYLPALSLSISRILQQLSLVLIEFSTVLLDLLVSTLLPRISRPAHGKHKN